MSLARISRIDRMLVNSAAMLSFGGLLDVTAVLGSGVIWGSCAGFPLELRG